MLTIVAIMITVVPFFGCQTATTANLTSVASPEKIPMLSKAEGEKNQDVVIEINVLFSRMTETWKEKDVAGHKALWAPGAEIITKRNGSFKMNPENDDPQMLKRMNSEWRTYKPLIDTLEFNVNGYTAKIRVDFNCPEGRLTMAYDLKKVDGNWLIERQKAL